MHEYVAVFALHFYEGDAHRCKKVCLRQQAPSEWHARNAMLERVGRVRTEYEFGFILLSMAKLTKKVVDRAVKV